MKANEALKLVNSSVRELKAYHLVPRPADIKLNQNENPHDWPDHIKKKVADFCLSRPWNRYPEFIPTQLKEALAQYAGTSSSNIIVGNGSNEVLLVLLLSLGKSDRPVVICEPTFTVYSLLVNGLGGSVHRIPLRNDLSYDVESIARAVKENPGSILIVASPNNPTGSSLSEDDLRRILEVHTGFLILDQAYVEFGGFNAVKMVNEFSNLVVTRTFSKALGGAGLRLGYMIGDEEIISEVNKVKLPYNINIFSDYVAQVLLEDRTEIDRRIDELRRRSRELADILVKFPFERQYTSDANFVLVRTAHKQELFDFLIDRTILVRDVSGYPMLENCLRISAGSENEQFELRKTLQEFFAGLPK